MIQLYATRIQVEFDEESKFIRKPSCPDRFVWNKQLFQIEETLAEWRTDGRIRSSLLMAGLARIHFRVRVSGGRIFELYYDPRKRVGDRQRAGEWILSAEILE